MFKFDRTYFRSSSLATTPKEIDNYKGYSFKEIAAIFSYLQSVAYNYDINNPIKMDKSVYSSRKK